MESNCCGASEWMEGTDICSECKEHAEFEEYSEEEDMKTILRGLDKYERIISNKTVLSTHPYYYDADEEEVTDWNI